MNCKMFWLVQNRHPTNSSPILSDDFCPAIASYGRPGISCRCVERLAWLFFYGVIMQRLPFTVIAYAAIIACVDGHDPKDPVMASDTGPEHANLKAFAGTWELTIDGVKEKGSAEIKSILGGRFITEDVKLPFGNFNMDWHGVIGYDRVKKQYTGVWFDNTGNTTKSDTGEADGTGRILSFRGEHVGKAKFLWRISNDGKKAMTI